MKKFRFLTTLSLSIAAAIVAGIATHSWLVGIIAGFAVLIGPYAGLAFSYNYAQRIQGNDRDFRNLVLFGWLVGTCATVLGFAAWLAAYVSDRELGILCGVVLLVIEGCFSWLSFRNLPPASELR